MTKLYDGKYYFKLENIKSVFIRCMKTIVSSSILLLITFHIVVAQSPISFYVIDDRTGDPISRVAIIADNKVIGFTNENGEFSYTFSRQEVSDVTFKHIGYETKVYHLATSSTNMIHIRMSRSVFHIGDLVVSASPTGSMVQYQPNLAINRDDLTRRNDVTVGQMLDGEPGVSMRSMGPAPSRPVIRGLDGERILILENGLRMGDLSQTAPDHAVSLDPLATERLEIIRGPASLLYGSSALGGVINLITNDIPFHLTHGWNGMSSGTYSSASGLVTLFNQIGYAATGQAVTARYGYKGSSNTKTPDGAIPNTALKSHDFSVGWAHQKQNHRYGFSLGFIDSGYGLPADFEVSDETVEIFYQKFSAQARAEGVMNGFVDRYRVSLNASYYLQDEEVTYTEGDAIMSDIPLYFSQTYISSTVLFQHRPYGRFDRGALGLDLNLRSLDVNGDDAFVPGDSYLNLAAYVYEEIPIGNRAKMQLGVRFDSRFLKTKELEPGDMRHERTDLNVAGSIGLNVPIGNFTVGAQVARAHRYPTVEELFADGIHLGAGAYEIGNAELGTEVGYGFDLFILRNWNNGTVELTAFANLIDNFVIFNPTGEVHDPSGFPVFEYIGGRAYLRGFEARFQANIGNYWSFSVNSDLVLGDRVDNLRERLPFMAPFRIRSIIKYQRNVHWVQLSNRTVARQTRVAPEEETTSGYSIINVAMGSRFGKLNRHQYILRLENIFNTSYRDHLSRIENRNYHMPARHLVMTYQFQF